MKGQTYPNEKKIVIFASGSGTNTENIINYFQKSATVEVAAVFSNHISAKVLKKAHKLNVKAIHFDREALYGSNDMLNILKDINPDLIVLAGFLWLMPPVILKTFHNKVINIHPALLPKYGGKGMYGMNVHKAVIGNKDPESGISIHLVNEKYDEGKLIFQTTTEVEKTDTPQSLAEKIHKLEHQYFPKVIQDLLENKA